MLGLRYNSAGIAAYITSTGFALLKTMCQLNIQDAKREKHALRHPIIPYKSLHIRRIPRGSCTEPLREGNLDGAHSLPQRQRHQIRVFRRYTARFFPQLFVKLLRSVFRVGEVRKESIDLQPGPTSMQNTGLQ